MTHRQYEDIIMVLQIVSTILMLGVIVLNVLKIKEESSEKIDNTYYESTNSSNSINYTNN